MNQTVERSRTEAPVARVPINDGLLRMAMAVSAASALRAEEVAIATRPHAPAPMTDRARGSVRVDFHAVEVHQREIDGRLANWAAWCNGSWGGPGTSPMFRMVPPPPRVRGDIAYGARIVDKADAAKIAAAVIALPEKHRKAVHWAYVRPVSPKKTCRELGVDMDDLYRLLRDGRQMLINRGA